MQIKITKTVELPEPRKFNLTYRSLEGNTKQYKISAPIEANAKTFCTYCFGGEGIKTFKIDGIVDLAEIQ